MSSSVQYRVVVGRKDERVEGPDDAELVVSAAFDVVTADDFDPAVAFMRGKLKSTGPTGSLFDVLRSGEVKAQLSALAARP